MKTIKRFTIKIYCQSCRTLLYKYSKEGPGSLVKCFVSSILEDDTNGDCKCPKCKNNMNFEGRNNEVIGKRKKCVYCNRSFEVSENIVKRIQ